MNEPVVFTAESTRDIWELAGGLHFRDSLRTELHFAHMGNRFRLHAWEVSRFARIATLSGSELPPEVHVRVAAGLRSDKGSWTPFSNITMWGRWGALGLAEAATLGKALAAAVVIGAAFEDLANAERRHRTALARGNNA